MSKHGDKMGTDHLLKPLYEPSSKGNLMQLLLLCWSICHLRSLPLSVEFKGLIEGMTAVSNNI